MALSLRPKLVVCSHWERISPLQWLALLLIGSAAVRLVIAFWYLPPDSAYWADVGAYMLNRDAWLGIYHDTALQPRPPLAPGGMLVPFTAVWGDFAGLHVWATVGALCVTGASYYFSRAILTPPQSLAVAALSCVHPWLMEGWAFTPLVLYGWALTALAFRPVLDWSLGVEDKTRIAIMACALALLPYVNQTFAGLCVLVFAVGVPSALAVRWKRHRMRSSGSMLAGMGAGLAVAVFALPYYLPVAPGSDVVRSGFEWELEISFVNADYVRVTAFPGLLFAWVAIRLRQWVLWAGLALSSVAAVLEVNDEAVWNLFFRSNYLSAMFQLPLFALVLWRVFRCRTALRAVTASVLLATAVAAFMVVYVGSASESYAINRIAAFEWMNKSGKPGNTVHNSWGDAKLSSALTHRGSIEAFHFEGIGPHPPNYIARSAYAARCIFQIAECPPGTTAQNEIEAYDLRYAVWNKQLLPTGHSVEVVLRRFDALPYTRLVWQRGEFYIWELDREAAAEYDSASR